MDEKYLIIGNWKMNKTPSQSLPLVEELVASVKKSPLQREVRLAICPPFTSLDRLSALLKDSPIALGAQNLYAAEEGAFTGEISPSMLRDLGVSYVIIGHSERRSIFKESDALIRNKIDIAQRHQLTPILCLGETLAERERGAAKEVIERQMDLALEGIREHNLIIAYEPIWAIGTGKTATPSMAQEMHAFIRHLLEKQFPEVGKKIAILYGGSMKPDNAAELLAQRDICGGLIGGASLVAGDFMAIARSIPAS
ncbi:MAG: triose-phosphate isomerase [Puniceicoccales bacterium]|jgi:triosephosphate isomerase|nr:triose-phosphate isomerase [Puniceicoccales bacterium]